MTATSACPDLEKLRLIVHGGLSEDEAQAVESHLLACDSCFAAARKLEADDTLLQGNEQSTTLSDDDDAPMEEQISELVARLKSLPTPLMSFHTSTDEETSLALGVPSHGVDREQYDFLAPPQAPDELGRLGPYRVLKVLGAGGMGVVFLAEDQHLDRRVALKAMLPSLAASASAKQRFFREARSAAALKHDHVVTIYQVGEDRGVPFLTMELLEGEALDDRLKRERKLLPAEVMRIGREMAEGLAAAHARGLIHRDIKPANIWLEAPRGRVKILDFGLARLNSEAGQLTQSGAIVGTPAYMAPEQARGLAVDGRTDLFSLGAVLYRMATGRTPFSGSDSMSMLLSLASDTPAHPRSLNPDLPQHVANLIAQLLEKDAAKRPQSAREVAQLLAGAPEVEALPGVSGERRAEFQFDEDDNTQVEVPLAAAAEPEVPARRDGQRRGPKHQRGSGVLIALAIALLLLIGGGFGAYKLLFETKDGTLIVEVDGDADVRFKNGELRVFDAEGKLKYTLKPGERDKKMSPGAYKVEVVSADGVKLDTDKFEMSRDGRVTLRVTADGAGAAVAKKDPKIEPLPIVAGPSPLDALNPAQIPAAERFDWQPKELVAVIGEHRQRHWGQVQALAIRPDGKQAASGGIDGRVRFWDTATRRELQELHLIGNNVVHLIYSRDGSRLAIGWNNTDVQLWDLSGAKAKMHATLPDTRGAIPISFSDDHKTLLALNSEGASLWDLSKAEPQVRDRYPKCGGAALAADGKTLALVYSEDPNVRIFELTEAKPKQRAVLPGNEGKVQPDALWQGVTFAPDGRLATFDPERTVRLWDISGPMPKIQTTIKQMGHAYVTFAANGKRMATKYQTDVQIWGLDGETPERLARIEPNPFLGPVSAFALSPDGRTLITGHGQGAIRFWEVKDDQLIEQGSPKPQPFVDYSWGTLPVLVAQGTAVASPAEDDRVRVWHFGGANPSEATFPGDPPRKGFLLGATPDGKTMLTSGNNTVQLWHVDGTTVREAEILKTLNLPADRGALSPNGKTLALGHGDKISLWDLSGPAARETFNAAMGTYPLRFLTFSPDGRSLFASVEGDKVRRWSVADGKLTEQAKIPYDGHLPLAVTPDGKILAVLNLYQLFFWNLAEGKPEIRLPMEHGRASSAAFSPDGKTAVTAGNQLIVWEVATGRKLREWTLPGAIRWAAYAADGRHLFTANSNGTIYVLRLGEKTPAIPATTDPDRRAAEWVLSIGGAISIKQNGKERTIKAVAELPREAFELTGLNLGYNPKVSDAGLAAFKDCKNLLVLHISNTPVGDAGLAHFKDCKKLTTLYLGATQVSDEGLGHFKNCENLMELDLSAGQVTDVGLHVFKDCKNLTALYLRLTKVSQAGLARLKDYKNLKYVNLHETQVRDADLANLKDWKNLTHLDLGRSQVSDEGLTHLKECKNLAHVTLQKTKVTAAGVDELKKALPLCKIEWDGGVIEPTASPDPDRKAAEWVLSIGGTVGVNGEAGVRKTVAELPKDPFQLTNIYLLDNKQVSDAGLANVQDCKNLISLDLNGTSVGDAGLVHFKKCKNLTHLELDNTKVGDVGLANFKDCKDLVFLELLNTQVSDAGLAHFKNCKNLTYLELSSTQVSDAGLAHLKDCKNLTRLHLGATQVSDAGLVHFKDCKLTQLSLSVTQVSDAGLVHFKDFKNLTYLHLGSTKVSDAGLALFKDCKALTKLSLDSTKVSDAGLAHFKNCKNLAYLHLHNTLVSDAGLVHFKECKKLTTLNLRRTKVTAAGIEGMKKALPQCKIEWDSGVIEPTTILDSDRTAAEWVLSIGGKVRVNDQEADLKSAAELPKVSFQLAMVFLDNNPQVSDAGLAHLKDCKNLTLLSLTETQVGDAGMVHFKDCKKLEYLFLNSTKVCDAGLAHFRDCKNLAGLFLYGTIVSDEGLAVFKDCKNLEILNLGGTKVSDMGLAHFKNSKNLTSLYLHDAQVGNAGLEHFKDCKSLRILDLNNTKVSDAGLAHFKDCKKLTYLRLGQTAVSDVGLAPFKDCKKLTQLLLLKTKVTAAGLDGLKKELPQCKIEWDGGVIEPKG